MEIKHDYSYLSNNKILVEEGLANDMVGKICFRAESSDIKTIAEYLEEHFRMYQYKKDNGVMFKTEDLFFWTNQEKESMTYFDVTVKAESPERHNEIVNSIIKYIEINFSGAGLYVRLQYARVKDWESVNTFLMQEFDLDSLPLEVLRLLHEDKQYVGREYTKESILKLDS